MIVDLPDDDLELALLEKLGKTAELLREGLAIADGDPELDDAEWKAAAVAFLDAWDGRQPATWADLAVLMTAVDENTLRWVAERRAKRRAEFAGRDTQAPPS